MTWCGKFGEECSTRGKMTFLVGLRSTVYSSLLWVIYHFFICIPEILHMCGCLEKGLKRGAHVSLKRKGCLVSAGIWCCWTFCSPRPMCTSHCGLVPLSQEISLGIGHSSWIRTWRCSFPASIKGGKVSK